MMKTLFLILASLWQHLKQIWRSRDGGFVERDVTVGMNIWLISSEDVSLKKKGSEDVITHCGGFR